MKNNDEKDSLWINFGIYGAVGIQLGLTVVAGWFMGNYFDQRWNTSPWLALTGLISGFIGGFYNLIHILNWHQKNR